MNFTFHVKMGTIQDRNVMDLTDSSSPAFLMMYSAYKLNKQGDNIQP